MSGWQLQTAKSQFSELVKRAQSDGPQQITVHGKPVAMVISQDLFEKLSSSDESLFDFMQRSPLFDHDEIEFVREPGFTRDVNF
jgi:prevent-host-death family protein